MGRGMHRELDAESEMEDAKNMVWRIPVERNTERPALEGGPYKRTLAQGLMSWRWGCTKGDEEDKLEL